MKIILGTEMVKVYGEEREVLEHTVTVTYGNGYEKKTYHMNEKGALNKKKLILSEAYGRIH